MEETGKPEYSNLQENIATGFYILFVVALIITILGIIWSLGEIFIGYAKFAWFVSLGLGLQIVIIGALVVMGAMILRLFELEIPVPV